MEVDGEMYSTDSNLHGYTVVFLADDKEEFIASIKNLDLNRVKHQESSSSRGQ